MSETPKNLSGAIKRAREMHRAEIAERLRRRQDLERKRLEQLNTVPRATPSAPPATTAEVDPSLPEAASAPEAATLAEASPTAEAVPLEPRVVETLPTERYLKVRNAIFDELARYLSGNQYKVYMEIYRETLGRRQPTPFGHFRPREMARELGIGSDQTVYRALRDLEQNGLLTCEARVGDTRGTKITLFALETTLDGLRRNAPTRRGARSKITTVKITTVKNTEVKSTTAVQQESLQYYGENHDGTVVKITTLHHDHERHERQPKTAATPAERGDGGERRSQLVDEFIARYGYSPRLAAAALNDVAEPDLELIPFLLARLDRAVERGQHRKGAVIQNPAGILSGWLADFASWRAVLEADRERAASAAEGSAPQAQDRYTEYLTEMDADAAQKIDLLEPADRARLEQEARADIARTFPASSEWPEEHWERAILAHLKRTQFERPTFEAWLARRGEPA
jgi:hypothetical protein